MASKSGFDWLLIDSEHGMMDHGNVIRQLQATASGMASPIVRVGWNDQVEIKRALDAGASGIMIPYVSSAEEAEQAVRFVKYPPRGVRGTAKMTRASEFGSKFDRYFDEANDQTLVVVQIETPAGADAAEAIAQIDGVDVLFIGPLDLSINLGGPHHLDEDRFDQCVQQVVEACERHSKTAGVLAAPSNAMDWIDKGCRFVAIGSAGLALQRGFAEFQKAGRGE